MKSSCYAAIIWLWVTLCPLIAHAAEVMISSPDSGFSSEIAAIRVGKQVFLNLDSVSSLLPITLRYDSAGVFVLCTVRDCVPVFAMDSTEVAFQDNMVFLRADIVGRALGCKAKIRREKVQFSCEAFDSARVGTQIGDRAPGFRLANEDSTVLLLSNLQEKGAVLLVFVRSAQWDPFTRDLLREIENHSSLLRNGGFSIAAIHGYNLKLSKSAVDSLKLSFPILSDPFGAVMRGYDVFDKGSLPFPAVFVIDQSGIIRYRKVWMDFTQPPDWESVMRELEKVEK